MGVALTEILVMKETSMEYFSSKSIVVDAPLWMYQFLSSIRQQDGNLLTDSKGNVTSHLVGILSRVTNLLENRIKPAFAFDGKPPELKFKTLEKRKEIKIDAQKKYDDAEKRGDIEEMKKYAQRTSRLTSEMIREAKELLSAFGIPAIESPSEAEAQASYIVKKKEVFALATNDADALMFGSPRIVRNLNMAGRRKKTGTLSYQTINPDIIELDENLRHLGLSQEQFIALCMLVGTDFNSGGIKGIGPKNALKLVKKFGDDFDLLFKNVKWNVFFDFEWQEVFDVITKMPVTDDYELKWKAPDKEKILKILVDGHDFSEERVNSQIKELIEKNENKGQKGLGEFFG